MTVEEVGAKMDALGVWDAALPCHWALKPRGTAFPYFCCMAQGEVPLVRMRFLMLDGWQTFHDFIRHQLDRDFGFYSTPMEMPHFELVILHDGTMRLFRHEIGYLPREAKPAERDLCVRMLWEAYGILLRLESDNRLPLKFAEEQAMFARVEQADGTWRDEPLAIPPPRPHVEQVTFPKKMLAEAKDLPFQRDEALELDLRIVPGVTTREPRPRILYLLAAFDAKTGSVVFCDHLAVEPEGGLHGLWESVPPRVLSHFIARHAVPGELHVRSMRVFRLMRPLGLQLPFKLVKTATLPHFRETDILPPT